MRRAIKFNDNYPKLFGQSYAKLLEVFVVKKEDISKELFEYDCKKSDGSYYKLKSDKYIQLIFLGNKNIPFSTFRSYTFEKHHDYYKKVGLRFDLEVSN